MIETKHKAYSIVYDEEQNKWQCNELSLSADGLASLRKKIDEFGRNERRVERLPAYHLKTGWGDASATKAFITVLCEPRSSRYSEETEVTECWIVDGKGNREKVYLKDLTPIENAHLINVWRTATKEATAAKEREERALKAIPRCTASAVMKAAKETV